MKRIERFMFAFGSLKTAFGNWLFTMGLENGHWKWQTIAHEIATNPRNVYIFNSLNAICRRINFFAWFLFTFTLKSQTAPSLWWSLIKPTAINQFGVFVFREIFTLLIWCCLFYCVSCSKLMPNFINFIGSPKLAESKKWFKKQKIELIRSLFRHFIHNITHTPSSNQLNR